MHVIFVIDGVQTHGGVFLNGGFFGLKKYPNTLQPVQLFFGYLISECNMSLQMLLDLYAILNSYYQERKEKIKAEAAAEGPMPTYSSFEHRDESPIFSMDDFEGNLSPFTICVPREARILGLIDV